MNLEKIYFPSEITVHIDGYKKTIVKENGDIFYPSGKSKIHPSEIVCWIGKHKKYIGKNYNIINTEFFFNEAHIFVKETIQK